eukprot:g760.t1
MFENAAYRRRTEYGSHYAESSRANKSAEKQKDLPAAGKRSAAAPLSGVQDLATAARKYRNPFWKLKEDLDDPPTYSGDLAAGHRNLLFQVVRILFPRRFFRAMHRAGSVGKVESRILSQSVVEAERTLRRFLSRLLVRNLGAKNLRRLMREFFEVDDGEEPGTGDDSSLDGARSKKNKSKGKDDAVNLSDVTSTSSSSPTTSGSSSAGGRGHGTRKAGQKPINTVSLHAEETPIDLRSGHVTIKHLLRLEYVLHQWEKEEESNPLFNSNFLMAASPGRMQKLKLKKEPAATDPGADAGGGGVPSGAGEGEENRLRKVDLGSKALAEKYETDKMHVRSRLRVFFEPKEFEAMKMALRLLIEYHIEQRNGFVVRTNVPLPSSATKNVNDAVGQLPSEDTNTANEDEERLTIDHNTGVVIRELSTVRELDAKMNSGKFLKDEEILVLSIDGVPLGCKEHAVPVDGDGKVARTRTRLGRGAGRVLVGGTTGVDAGKHPSFGGVEARPPHQRDRVSIVELEEVLPMLGEGIRFLDSRNKGHERLLLQLAMAVRNLKTGRGADHEVDGSFPPNVATNGSASTGGAVSQRHLFKELHIGGNNHAVAETQAQGQAEADDNRTEAWRNLVDISRKKKEKLAGAKVRLKAEADGIRAGNKKFLTAHSPSSSSHEHSHSPLQEQRPRKDDFNTHMDEMIERLKSTTRFAPRLPSSNVWAGRDKQCSSGSATIAGNDLTTSGPREASADRQLRLFVSGTSDHLGQYEEAATLKAALLEAAMRSPSPKAAAEDLLDAKRDVAQERSHQLETKEAADARGTALLVGAQLSVPSTMPEARSGFGMVGSRQDANAAAFERNVGKSPPKRGTGPAATQRSPLRPQHSRSPKPKRPPKAGRGTVSRNRPPSSLPKSSGAILKTPMRFYIEDAVTALLQPEPKKSKRLSHMRAIHSKDSADIVARSTRTVLMSKSLSPGRYPAPAKAKGSGSAAPAPPKKAGPAPRTTKAMTAPEVLVLQSGKSKTTSNIHHPAKAKIKVSGAPPPKVAASANKAISPATALKLAGLASVAPKPSPAKSSTTTTSKAADDGAATSSAAASSRSSVRADAGDEDQDEPRLIKKLADSSAPPPDEAPVFSLSADTTEHLNALRAAERELLEEAALPLPNVEAFEDMREGFLVQKEDWEHEMARQKKHFALGINRLSAELETSIAFMQHDHDEAVKALRGQLEQEKQQAIAEHQVKADLKLRLEVGKMRATLESTSSGDLALAAAEEKFAWEREALERELRAKLDKDKELYKKQLDSKLEMDAASSEAEMRTNLDKDMDEFRRKQELKFLHEKKSVEEKVTERLDAEWKAKFSAAQAHIEELEEELECRLKDLHKHPEKFVDIDTVLEQSSAAKGWVEEKMKVRSAVRASVSSPRGNVDDDVGDVDELSPAEARKIIAQLQARVQEVESKELQLMAILDAQNEALKTARGFAYGKAPNEKEVLEGHFSDSDEAGAEDELVATITDVDRAVGWKQGVGLDVPLPSRPALGVRKIDPKNLPAAVRPEGEEQALDADEDTPRAMVPRKSLDLFHDSSEDGDEVEDDLTLPASIASFRAQQKLEAFRNEQELGDHTRESLLNDHGHPFVRRLHEDVDRLFQSPATALTADEEYEMMKEEVRTRRFVLQHGVGPSKNEKHHVNRARGTAAQRHEREVARNKQAERSSLFGDEEKEALVSESSSSASSPGAGASSSVPAKANVGNLHASDGASSSAGPGAQHQHSSSGRALNIDALLTKAELAKHSTLELQAHLNDRSRSASPSSITTSPYGNILYDGPKLLQIHTDAKLVVRDRSRSPENSMLRCTITPTPHHDFVLANARMSSHASNATSQGGGASSGQQAAQGAQRVKAPALRRQYVRARSVVPDTNATSALLDPSTTFTTPVVRGRPQLWGVSPPVPVSITRYESVSDGPNASVTGPPAEFQAHEADENESSKDDVGGAADAGEGAGARHEVVVEKTGLGPGAAAPGDHAAPAVVAVDAPAAAAPAAEDAEGAEAPTERATRTGSRTSPQLLEVQAGSSTATNQVLEVKQYLKYTAPQSLNVDVTAMLSRNLPQQFLGGLVKTSTVAPGGGAPAGWTADDTLQGRGLSRNTISHRTVMSLSPQTEKLIFAPKKFTFA